MNNLKLLAWIKLHMPELNSLQIDKLRQKFNEVERNGRIDELTHWASFFTDDSMNARTPSERLYKRIAELQKGEE